MNESASLKDQLTDAMIRLDEKTALSCTEQLLTLGIPFTEFQDCLNQGLNRVNELFEQGEYFIADLMFAGMIYRAVLDLLPLDDRSPGYTKGVLLIGVVERDIHAIGKDIVSGLLKANSFDVIDLGTNVSPQTFVEAIKKHHPQIVLMSGMMHYSQESMRQTVEAIREAGLRQDVTIIIGGDCADESVVEYIGADAVVRDPLDTVALCNISISRGTHEDE